MDTYDIQNLIYAAIEDGQIAETKRLFTNHPELLNITTPFGTWLHVAADFGKLEIVKYLVSRGLDINKKSGILEGNALNEAASEGHIDVVEYLFSCGAQLDVSESHYNPLFSAILKGHLDVVKFLIASGIDFRVKYSGKRMKNMGALEFALERGQIEIANYLRSIQ